MRLSRGRRLLVPESVSTVTVSSFPDPTVSRLIANSRRDAGRRRPHPSFHPLVTKPAIAEEASPLLSSSPPLLPSQMAEPLRAAARCDGGTVAGARPPHRATGGKTSSRETPAAKGEHFYRALVARFKQVTRDAHRLGLSARERQLFRTRQLLRMPTLSNRTNGKSVPSAALEAPGAESQNAFVDEVSWCITEEVIGAFSLQYSSADESSQHGDVGHEVNKRHFPSVPDAALGTVSRGCLSRDPSASGTILPTLLSALVFVCRSQHADADAEATAHRIVEHIAITTSAAADWTTDGNTLELFRVWFTQTVVERLPGTQTQASLDARVVDLRELFELRAHAVWNATAGADGACAVLGLSPAGANTHSNPTAAAADSESATRQLSDHLWWLWHDEEGSHELRKPFESALRARLSSGRRPRGSSGGTMGTEEGERQHDTDALNTAESLIPRVRARMEEVSALPEWRQRLTKSSHHQRKQRAQSTAAAFWQYVLSHQDLKFVSAMYVMFPPADDTDTACLNAIRLALCRLAATTSLGANHRNKHTGSTVRDRRGNLTPQWRELVACVLVDLCSRYLRRERSHPSSSEGAQDECLRALSEWLATNAPTAPTLLPNLLRHLDREVWRHHRQRTISSSAPTSSDSAPATTPSVSPGHEIKTELAFVSHVCELLEDHDSPSAQQGEGVTMVRVQLLTALGTRLASIIAKLPEKRTHLPPDTEVALWSRYLPLWGVLAADAPAKDSSTAQEGITLGHRQLLSDAVTLAVVLSQRWNWLVSPERRATLRAKRERDTYDSPAALITLSACSSTTHLNLMGDYEMPSEVRLKLSRFATFLEHLLDSLCAYSAAASRSLCDGKTFSQLCSAARLVIRESDAACAERLTGRLHRLLHSRVSGADSACYVSLLSVHASQRFGCRRPHDAVALFGRLLGDPRRDHQQGSSVAEHAADTPQEDMSAGLVHVVACVRSSALPVLQKGEALWRVVAAARARGLECIPTRVWPDVVGTFLLSRRQPVGRTGAGSGAPAAMFPFADVHRWREGWTADESHVDLLLQERALLDVQRVEARAAMQLHARRPESQPRHRDILHAAAALAPAKDITAACRMVSSLHLRGPAGTRVSTAAVERLARLHVLLYYCASDWAGECAACADAVHAQLLQELTSVLGPRVAAAPLDADGRLDRLRSVWGEWAATARAQRALCAAKGGSVDVANETGGEPCIRPHGGVRFIRADGADEPNAALTETLRFCYLPSSAEETVAYAALKTLSRARAFPALMSAAAETTVERESSSAGGHSSSATEVKTDFVAATSSVIRHTSF